MFYISHVEPDSVGVTDTEDGVEEFYTKSDLEKLISKSSPRIKIEGMTYTGSKFVYERKNASIVILEHINKGDSFQLIRKGFSEEVLYIGENGKRDFVFFNGCYHTLTRKSLLSGDYSVSLQVHMTEELRSLFKQIYPTSALAQYL